MMNYEKKESFGLITGGGPFPLMAAKAARQKGFRVVAVAHEGESDPALSAVADEVIWIKLGQLGQLIKAFKNRGVKEVLMAGTIEKRKMFGHIRPDLRAIKIFSKLAFFHDDDILRALANELEREGIKIISSTQYLPELLAPEGNLTIKKPSPSEMKDITFGWTVAEELGRLDIGQSVVVRQKTVLAVEALEGTDEAILRGGRLAKEKAVVVKRSKPNQDLRFDVPSVGLGTIEIMSQVKASTLAIEAGKTLIFDKAEMIQAADKARISIVSRR